MCLSFDTAPSFLFINRIRQTICSKRCFLTTKREIEIRTILFRKAATSIVQCIRQGQHTGTLDSIYNHPRLSTSDSLGRRGFILDD